MSIYIDENENCLACSASSASISTRAYQSTIHWHETHTDDSELDDMKHDEKILGDGSEEDDSLLVIYQDSDA